VPIFPWTAGSFAKSNPLRQLALTYAPLAADFKCRQVVFSDHSLQGTRRDVEHLRGFAEGEQPETFQFSFHRISSKHGLSNAGAIDLTYLTACFCIKTFTIARGEAVQKWTNHDGYGQCCERAVRRKRASPNVPVAVQANSRRWLKITLLAIWK
jgi:hypothetical protein